MTHDEIKTINLLTTQMLALSEKYVASDKLNESLASEKEALKRENIRLRDTNISCAQHLQECETMLSETTIKGEDLEIRFSHLEGILASTERDKAKYKEVLSSALKILEEVYRDYSNVKWGSKKDARRAERLKSLMRGFAADNGIAIHNGDITISRIEQKNMEESKDAGE